MAFRILDREYTWRRTEEEHVKMPNTGGLFRHTESGIAVAAILLFLVFSIFTTSFLTPYNLFNVSRNISFYVFIGLGQAVVMLTGGMNVSFGAIGGLTTVVIGFLVAKLGMPIGAAVCIAILVGMLCGLLNGLLITRFWISDFVVTLATSFIFTGLDYGISKGFPYVDLPRAITVIGRDSFLGLPIIAWMMILVVIVTFLFFSHTVSGRFLLATGSNINAAKLSGINTSKMRIIAHVLSGSLAALTAFFYVSKMGSAQPANGGDWMITSFAVAVVGGTSLSGGSISAIGLVLGGIIMVFVKNGLVLMNANVYFEQALIGGIILIVVILDGIRSHRQSLG
jgi:ribose transport system permease protein